MDIFRLHNLKKAKARKIYMEVNKKYIAFIVLGVMTIEKSHQLNKALFVWASASAFGASSNLESTSPVYT